LASGVLLALGRVCGCAFVDYDDPSYVTENVWIQRALSQRSFLWAFSTTQECHWHPLTWLSLELDYQLYGPDPCGFHLSNLLLHLAGTLVLFGALTEMTGAVWPSALVAALFALHPLHVESVAWVADRKDVLSGLFGALLLSAYAAYARTPTWGGSCMLSLTLALALMAKPMLVTAPFLLLLLDFWPLGRLHADGTACRVRLTDNWRLLAEKLPLFILAALTCLIAWYAQHRQGVGNPAVPLAIRIENMIVSYAEYLRSTLWPRGLGPFYPLPETGYPAWQIITSGLTIVLATAVACMTGSRAPFLPVGWCWFLIALAPVIGLISVLGGHARADRYTYWPLIGLFIALAWSLSTWAARGPRARAITGTAALAICFACAAASFNQTGYWRESTQLWSHVLEAQPDNYLAHNNFGLQCARAGQTELARYHFLRALDANGQYGPAHNNLGMLLADAGDFEQAIPHLEAALRVNSDLPATQNALGRLLTQMGDLQKGEAHLREALRQAPAHPDFCNNLALNLKRQGKLLEAKALLRQCLRIHPAHRAARYNLAATLIQLESLTEAKEELESVIRSDPIDAAAHNDLGVVLDLQGESASAEREFRVALDLAPTMAACHGNLALTLDEQGHHEEAGVEYALARRIDPSWPEQARRQAWMLATSNNAEQRNGSLGLRLARQACAGAIKPDSAYFDTLAAAYAEVGRFDDAQAAIARALLEAQGPRRETVPVLQERARLYARQRAFHQGPQADRSGHSTD
jgi:tetratricopeptide (TPR) repeat protein